MITSTENVALPVLNETVLFDNSSNLGSLIITFRSINNGGGSKVSSSSSAVSVNDTMGASKFCRPRRPIVARGRH